MNFMDKVKSGFSEAGSKAKVVVEVNKLRLQNSGKQKDIEKHYQEIGKIVFMTATDRLAEDASKDYQPMIEAILKLEQEISENRKQIKLLANEKDCECGKSSPMDAKFCASCGRTFSESD